MKRVFDHIRDRLLAAKQMQPPDCSYMLRLFKSEWSSKFEQLMRNRLVMGALRYGTLIENKGSSYQRVEDAIRRLNLYLDTGNDEHLVDAANLCLLEFEQGTHPNKHFTSVDDGEHCKKK